MGLRSREDFVYLLALLILASEGILGIFTSR